jgi:hypothetical protein
MDDAQIGSQNTPAPLEASHSAKTAHDSSIAFVESKRLAVNIEVLGGQLSSEAAAAEARRRYDREQELAGYKPAIARLSRRLCSNAGNVHRSPRGIDWPTSALSARVSALCPGLDVGRR